MTERIRIGGQSHVIDTTAPKSTDDPNLRKFNVNGFCVENEFDYVECSLAVNDVRLDIKASHKLCNHSDGFKWGYAGSGPAQSALAVLQHLFGDEFAMNHHQDLKWMVFAKLPGDKPFTIVVEMQKTKDAETDDDEYEFSFKKV